MNNIKDVLARIKIAEAEVERLQQSAVGVEYWCLEAAGDLCYDIICPVCRGTGGLEFQVLAVVHRFRCPAPCGLVYRVPQRGVSWGFIVGLYRPRKSAVEHDFTPDADDIYGTEVEALEAAQRQADNERAAIEIAIQKFIPGWVVPPNPQRSLKWPNP